MNKINKLIIVNSNNDRSGKSGFALIILFVFSIFLVSNFDTFKFLSINYSSIVSMLMLIYFIIDGFVRKKLVLHKHPTQNILFFLFIWASISLLIAKMFPSKAVPDEVYLYDWASGLNSPDFRGISFLARLGLSIFAIEFIITNINTKAKYLSVVNWFILAYSVMCTYILIQICLHLFLNVDIGYSAYHAQYYRAGGYVGEPSTLAGLLGGGYFIILSVVGRRFHGIWFSKNYLRFIFVVSTVELLFTLSTAWLIGILIVFLIRANRYLSKKKLISLFAIIIGIVYFTPLKEAVFVKAYAEGTGSNPRVYSWMAGIAIFLNNIITGVGIGQSVFFMPINMQKIWDVLFNRNEYLEMISFRFPPLNTYIQWMAELGVVFLVIFLYVFYTLFRYRKVIDIKHYPLVGLGFGGGLIVYLIAMNAIPDYFYVGYFNFLFAMYLSGTIIFRESNRA